MKRQKRECEVYRFGETVQAEGNIRKVIAKGFTPVYKTKGAAAADCVLPEDIAISPHETLKVDLCIGFEIPEDCCVMLYPRSSLLVKHGVMSPVSIIDSDYSRCHVHVVLHNLTDRCVRFEKGERVCQAILTPVVDCVDWEHEKNERDPNGFGGTGR